MIQEARELDDNSVDKQKTNFTKELSLFELNIERTSNVSKVHEALKTVVPTSVEAERTFSAAGLFITKKVNIIFSYLIMQKLCKCLQHESSSVVP